MNGEGLLKSVPSSEGTSGQYLWGRDKYLNNVSEAEPIEHSPFRHFIERVSYLGTNQGTFLCNKIHPAESSSPSFYKTEYLIDAHNFMMLVRLFKGFFSISSYQNGIINFNEYQDANLTSYVEGPPDAAWTAQTWTANSSECEYPYDLEISGLNNQLNLLLNDFKDGRSLVRSNELSQLADEVVKQRYQRANEDIELWAENLSKDLSKYSD